LRIALFITCLADAMFPEVGRATTRVLERLGHRVEFPPAQTCCGQMHVNTGYQRETLPLVQRFVDVFAGFDAVVAPSGSCVGSVRHQHELIAGGSARLRCSTRCIPWPPGRTSCPSSWSTYWGPPRSARISRTG
jgi:L-lactate dehydrogenase complex protein LldE